MKIYIVRHGQTDWNLKKIIQGKKDIELNETGIAQANQIREKVNNLDIDLIICSTLKRARKTAEIINKDKKVKIIYKEEIMERGMGDYEGMNSGVEGNDIYNCKKNITDMNIEPVDKLCQRIDKLFDEIKEKYSKNKILLVTHSGTARAIEGYFYGVDEEDYLPPEDLQNCEIREYELEI